MNISEKLAAFLRDRGSVPNKLTEGMGELIQRARLEADLGVEDLAAAVYFQPAEISAIERGQKEVSASELIYLAGALDKPITYFFPSWILHRVNPDYMTTEELELLMLMRKLDHNERRNLLAQIRQRVSVR